MYNNKPSSILPSASRPYSCSVLEIERKGDYLGDTIQVIPHITEEIKRRIRVVNKNKKHDIKKTNLRASQSPLPCNTSLIRTQIIDLEKKISEISKHF